MDSCFAPGCTALVSSPSPRSSLPSSATTVRRLRRPTSSCPQQVFFSDRPSSTGLQRWLLLLLPCRSHPVRSPVPLGPPPFTPLPTHDHPSRAPSGPPPSRPACHLPPRRPRIRPRHQSPRSPPCPTRTASRSSPTCRAGSRSSTPPPQRKGCWTGCTSSGLGWRGRRGRGRCSGLR